VRALLVDDHALFRAGLASLLRAWGIDVAGEGSNGDEAIACARTLRPDVIFMDINMPGRDGLEATRAIKAELPDVRIVMLTVSSEDHDLIEAVKSGAEGYLLKNLQEAQFADMVARVERGEPVFSPSLARKLLLEFSREQTSQAPERSDLTERERDVLVRVAAGATNKEIAARLVISENTVNFHMGNILSKLHLRNRAEVVRWAFEHGFATTPPR